MSELEIYKGMVKKMKDNEIKEIIRLNCEEEIEVKYFAKNDSLVDTTMDYSRLLDYITNLQQENEKLLSENITIKSVRNMVDETIYKSRCEKATNELFELKDMIYKPETRDENIPIQQKISSIIKQLNGRSDE